jgi:hypothetical protein
MKSRLTIAVTILPCLVIFFIIVYPTISNQNRIIKVGKKFLLMKPTDTALYEWHKMIHKYLTFPLDHGYGSHAIVLLAVLYATQSGPILELGMGSTSSPLLHNLAIDQKRLLVSADSDIRWINYFNYFTLNNTLHKLKHIEVKTEMGIEWASSALHVMQDWSVVFIDHRPGGRRQFDLTLYAKYSHIVVLHDTEKSDLYKYGRGLSVYPYKYRFKKLKTYTDVLSEKNETIINRVQYLLASIPDIYFTNITLNEIS